MVDYGPLIKPPRELPRSIVKIIDLLSWLLPILSAILSTWSGVEALHRSRSLRGPSRN